MEFPRLKQGGWIVVADGGRFRILVNDGTPDSPRLTVRDEVLQDNPFNREQGSDRPGRLSDGGTGHRSAVETTDWHDEAEKQFVAELAARLEQHAARKDFDQLIVIAAPQSLGKLRSAMGPLTRAALLADIAKDLTKHPVQEISKMVLGTG